MKNWLIRSGLLAMILCGVVPAADARGPRWSGLEAVALSPNAKTLVIGGQNRVLYILDAANLEVRQRLWLGVRIGFVAFNREGNRLLVEDDAQTIRLYDTDKWNVIKTFSPASFTVVAPAANLAAVQNYSFGKSEIRLLSLSDLSEKGKIEVNQGAVAFGLSPDGKSLAALTHSQATKDEMVVKFNKIPNDLQGIKRKEFVQRHDGQAADLLVFDTATGKLLRQTKLWYTTYEATLAFVNETAYVMTYDNQCAKVTKEGEITLFETSLNINYSIGISFDGKTLVAGGFRDGIISSPGGTKKEKFQIDLLGGSPEYFCGFSVGNDGTIFGVTSGFRLVKISPAGKVEKVVPVY